MIKRGIIQSRGLGDILIALPIARYFYLQGEEIHWPICREFLSSVKDTVNWINWYTVELDERGDFFYMSPMRVLTKAGCKLENIVCLYQSLNTSPELGEVPWFQIQHFDEFKYTKTGVPFLKKWTLDECFTRNIEREIALKNKLVKNTKYYLTQFKGSNFEASPDLSLIPADWQRIDVDENLTDCIFDWITLIKGAQAVICIDSAMSNMIDQLGINDVDKYWIPRSHIHLTPVLGTNWTILDPPLGSLASQKIFAAVPVRT